MDLGFYRTPWILRWLAPGLTWSLEPEQKQKVVYLTFDDGPVPGPTDFVLTTLATHDAKATFFCIGDNVRKHPETFQQVIHEGHRVGNHTFNHLSAWSTETSRFLKNVEECQRILPESTTPLFRPPFGKITPGLSSQLRSKGYSIIMWDLLSFDYDRNINIQNSLRQLKRLTRPGSIVVFHDSHKAMAQLRQLLPPYMEFLSTSGYQMESIPDGR